MLVQANLFTCLVASIGLWAAVCTQSSHMRAGESGPGAEQVFEQTLNRAEFDATGWPRANCPRVRSFLCIIQNENNDTRFGSPVRPGMVRTLLDYHISRL